MHSQKFQRSSQLQISQQSSPQNSFDIAARVLTDDRAPVSLLDNDIGRVSGVSSGCAISLNVACRNPRQGGEMLFRDGYLLRWDGDRLVRMCRSFPLTTAAVNYELTEKQLEPLRRVSLWIKAVEDTLVWCEKLNKKLNRLDNNEDDDADNEPLGIDVPFLRLAPTNPVPCPFTVENAWRYHGWDYAVMFVPKISKNSRAKTSAGQQRAVVSFRQDCAERREQMLLGVQMLRDSGFFKHSNSFDGTPDKRQRCPRCHGTYWTGRPLRCHDCRWVLRERKASAIPEFGKNSRLIGLSLPKFGAKGRQRRSCTPKELLLALLCRGDLLRANTDEKALRLVGVSRILIDGWLPRDVAEEIGENPETLRTHADRIHRTIEKQRSEPSPERQLVCQRLQAAQRNPLIRQVLDMLI